MLQARILINNITKKAGVVIIFKRLCLYLLKKQRESSRCFFYSCSSKMTISTRLFFLIFSLESLGSIGCVYPQHANEKRSILNSNSATRKRITLLALAQDNFHF